MGHTGWLTKHFPEMTWDWPHLVYLRKQLLRVTHGEVDRIAIALPAQHAKTKGTLIPYGAWRMLREPGLRVAIGSHTQRYADKISKTVRRMVIQAGGVLADSKRADEWELTNGSTFIAKGVGSALAGHSVDCVPAGTMIHTDRGLFPVEHICTVENKPHLLSLNHATGAVEYRRVVATRTTYATRLFELSTESGRTLRCTGNHRVYIEGIGYRQADSVRVGDVLLNVRDATQPEESRVQEVRVRSSQGAGQRLRHLRPLPNGFHSQAWRDSEIRSEWVQGFALFTGVPSCSKANPNGNPLQEVRRTNREANEQVLRTVSEAVRMATEENEQGCQLRDVRGDVQVLLRSGSLLLSEVFQRGPFHSDAGPRELAVLEREELREVLRGDAPAHFGAGRPEVRPVRRSRADIRVLQAGPWEVPSVVDVHSPHRRERSEQLARKLDLTVFDVSPAEPQVEVSTDRVCGIRSLGVDRQPVYDLQVEGNSNFFAGSILVHNCFLMDDVFGSREDADSVAMQERVYEWYMDDVTPRLQKTACLVMTNTRWNPGDLIGRIQQSEEWPEWVYVRIPAIAETQEERDRNNGSQGLPLGLPDPIGREAGRELCADRFPLDKLLQKQRIEGVGFESVYQQNPIPRGGTFFERRWLLGGDGRPLVKTLAELPLMSPMPGGRRLVRYYDLASSRSDSACYTSGVLLCKLGEGEDALYWVCDVVRGRWMPAERNEKMRAVAEQDAKIPGFEKTWFEQPVFDKNRAASRAIYAALAGFPVSGDNVSGSGSKELRAEPVAGAAKGGILKVVDGGWLPAFLNEVESFPRSTYKDQVDSLSGAFNRLSRGGFAISVG